MVVALRAGAFFGWNLLRNKGILIHKKNTEKDSNAQLCCFEIKVAKVTANKLMKHAYLGRQTNHACYRYRKENDLSLIEVEMSED